MTDQPKVNFPPRYPGQTLHASPNNTANNHTGLRPTEPAHPFLTAAMVRDEWVNAASPSVRGHQNGKATSRASGVAVESMSAA